MSYAVLLSDIDPYYSECLESQWGSIAEAVDEELAAMRAGYDSFEQLLAVNAYRQWLDNERACCDI